MNSAFVKLRIRGKANKYRKMLSSDERIYPELSELIECTYNYRPGANLDKGEWFEIEEISTQSYAIDLVTSEFELLDFDLLDKRDFEKIDYLFVKSGNVIFFQNISKSKLAIKKRIGSFGELYRYESQSNQLVVNEFPDAIYSKEENKLYFRRLESIVGIFKGISELYREATDEETENFLQNDFLSLQNGYSTTNVKTANRKRIALAMQTLAVLSDEERKNIFQYIGDYCPDLKTDNNKFSIGNEDELKMVLFGIEQRFYTTPVGGEKRIANSVITLK